MAFTPRARMPQRLKPEMVDAASAHDGDFVVQHRSSLMAFTAKRRTETSLSEINVTPFVDVVLVLLIIFMVTAPVLQSGIEVSVPKTKVVKEISEERLVISITKGQEVYLNNDHVRLDEIGDAAAQEVPRSARASRCTCGPMKTWPSARLPR